MTLIPTVLIALFIGIAVFCSRPEEFEGGTKGRHRRSIADLGFLIACKAKRNPFRYNGYGCYCGFGGYGQPVDGLDRCCQVHDNCYELLERRFNIYGIANYMAPYLINYFWCKCTDFQLTDFQKELCMCDQNAAECFKLNEYNPRYSKYGREKCFTPNGLNEQIEEEKEEEQEEQEQEEEDFYFKNGLK